MEGLGLAREPEETIDVLFEVLLVGEPIVVSERLSAFDSGSAVWNVLPVVLNINEPSVLS